MVDPELAMRFEPVVKSIYKKHDYHEYGGAPLLGANGIFFKCHGSSQARTIKAAVRNALAFAKLGINDGIVDALSKIPVSLTRADQHAASGVAAQVAVQEDKR